MIWGEWWEEGFRVGNSCTPVVDSCQCMAKQIQYCKVKKKKKPELEGRFHEKGMWADEGFCARQGQCIGLGQQSQRITWGV